MMQNMKMSCSIFALLLLSLGCKKEPLPLPIPTPPPNTQPSLKVRWQHALSPDTTDVSGDAWYTWEGRVIYSTDFTIFAVVGVLANNNDGAECQIKVLLASSPTTAKKLILSSFVPKFLSHDGTSTFDATNGGQSRYNVGRLLCL